MERGTSRRWVKLHVKGWLHGSIRWQHTAEERGVWADLIALAGECNREGAICDNDGKAFPLEFLANQLNISLTLLESTIEKAIVHDRITEKEGVIYITNWTTYQSEYERVKKYRQKEGDDKDKYVQGKYGHMVKR